ncbi:MAG: M14 family metallocarboxypeptidase [Planctomycetota bacterium]|nr:M14 family metallocarboxypeptidase [Planctomycetota bacterium]
MEAAMAMAKFRLIGAMAGAITSAAGLAGPFSSAAFAQAPHVHGPGEFAPDDVAMDDDRPLDGVRMVRLTITSFEHRDAIERLASLAACHGGLGQIEYLVWPENFQALRDLDPTLVVLIDDIGAVVRAQREEIERRARQRDLAWFENYHPLNEINDYLAQMATNFPALATAPASIGTSIEGRAINVIRISGPDRPENPRSQRAQVLFNGGQHAREWVNPATVVFIADQMLEQYATNPRVRALLDEVEFIFVPVVNPDGYVYSWTANGRLWRKNRRVNTGGSIGVDLNRNWAFQWGLNSGSSGTPSNDLYRGTAAFSEPETTALRNFIQANPRIRAHVDYHSFSQLLLAPWSYTLGSPPDNSVFNELNPQMVRAIFDVDARTYVAGPGGETIYLASGVASDWTFGDRGIWSYGIELRDTGQSGFLLPPDQIIPTGRENFAAALVLGEYVAQPFRFAFPDGIPSRGEPGSVQSFRVQLIDNNRPVLAGAPSLRYRAAGASTFSAAAMTLISGSTYEARFPAFSCGTRVEFYVEATSPDGRSARYPSQAPLASSLVSRSTTGPEVVLFADDFETDRGWTFGVAGDTATAGRWSRCDPQPTSAQPGDDASAVGTLAAITDCNAGGSDGAADLDNGVTTLLSPRVDARPPRGLTTSDVYVAYARWYSNDRGGSPNADSMPVEISADDGATWTTLETVAENLNAWTRRIFRVADFVEPSDRVRVRFVARDLGAGSLVEAGIDDLRVFAQGCPCAADFNGDGVGDFFDYLDFVNAYAAEDLAADFNGDAQVDFFDYLDFNAALQAGCE